MTIINPGRTTLGDLLTEALRESGVLGVGMQASQDQFARALSRMGWVLESWARKRLMIYALQERIIDCTSADYYTVGEGGDFTLDFSPLDFEAGDADIDPKSLSRPSRLQAVFFRQNNVSGQGPIDYPLEEISAGEDYWAKTRMKQLVAWPQTWYYQPNFPLGKLFIWPKPQALVGYQLGVVLRATIDLPMANQTTVIELPPEYHQAMVYACALQCRSAWQIPTGQGDALPIMYKQAMKTITRSNTRVGRLDMPGELSSRTRRGGYNGFSDNYSR